MRTLVVQRGHVARTTGATGTSTPDGSLTEQAFARLAADAIVEAMRPHRAEIEVRVIDADVATADYDGDAFVALHCDGSTSPSARGASVGYRTSEGAALARLWKSAYADLGWTGGWAADNYTAALAGYYGCVRAVAEGNRPAVILEHGFLTSPDDAALLRPDAGPTRTALAVRRAVTAWFGLPPVDDDLDKEEDRMALAVVIKGDKRGDGWVLGPAGSVVPLGGDEGAPVERQRVHRDLLVYLGLARVDKDGSSFEVSQAQVDACPRAATHPKA